MHRSLSYKAALKDDQLRTQLEEVFKPIASNAETYSQLGSSQQCEHANRAVMLRVPKSIHYGSSGALDFREHATSAFINEGRHYISTVRRSCSCSNDFVTTLFSSTVYMYNCTRFQGLIFLLSFLAHLSTKCSW